MLELNAKIQGKTQTDLEHALEEMLHRLKEEHVSDLIAVSQQAYSHNDGSPTSSFDVTVTRSYSTDYTALVEDPYADMDNLAE